MDTFNSISCLHNNVGVTNMEDNTLMKVKYTFLKRFNFCLAIKLWYNDHLQLSVLG